VLSALTSTSAGNGTTIQLMPGSQRLRFGYAPGPAVGPAAGGAEAWLPRASAERQ
jgi:hypothetical protein